MKILIVGGGIAGMAVAALLHRQNHNVQVVDTAPEYRHIGFGLLLWHYGRRVLDELGIGHHLLGKEYMLPRAVIQNTSYKPLNYIPYSSYGDYRPVSIHRADLHEGLREVVANIPVRFNTSVKAISQNDKEVTVHFSDDIVDSFDLVVGADGIHSIIRTLVMGNPVAEPYGWRTWFFWADTWKRNTEEVQIVLSSGVGFATFPLHDRLFASIYVACLPNEPDPLETRKERLHGSVYSFGKDVHDLIDSVDPKEIYKTDLMYVPMGPWAQGRVVLIGDARHAISPVTGRGANLALEDASVLAKMIKDVRAQDIPAILSQFSVERTRRVDPLRKHLRKLEKVMLVRSPLLAAARSTLLRVLPISLFVGKPDPKFL